MPPTPIFDDSSPHVNEEDANLRANPLLFEQFPELEDTIPWMSLGTLPTPIEKLEKLGGFLNHSNLWMKRDDLSGEKYGGNKLRKLEFIIADALKKKKWILTFGGLGSNHCLATAIYSREHGINCVLAFIDQPLTESVKEKLLLDSYYDAKLSYAKNIPGAFFKGLWHLITKRGVYFLWIGGTTNLGILGYVNAAFELAKQIEEGQMNTPEQIFIPVGTMGTYAGLKVGLHLAGVDTDLVGVRVTGTGIASEKGLVKMINNTFKFLHSRSNSIPQIRMQKDDIHLIHEFVGSEYGAVTTEGLDAQKVLMDQEGIEIETTYTAKTLAAMMQSIQDRNAGNGPILFWNTYNSAPLPNVQELSLDYKSLPRAFHKFFKEDSISEK
ncbi:MAG: 1-aminocyclopropane-1-carboxylate deaminase/D-cysteine desulfhydrase [Candidatus Thorarchaeota archaeon]|jgi:D-cysteine desulfhydrase